MIFFGGNGHCAARLQAAREALGAELEIAEAAYPGFEGRPRAESLEAFLDGVAAALPADGHRLAYATGIGGLIALALRARGRLSLPIVLQGAVGWGLEQRRFPRAMRVAPLRALAATLICSRRMQERHWRTHLCGPVAPALVDALRNGYRQCTAFGDLFRWFAPELLRDLERRFAADRPALEQVTVWIGDRDQIVGLDDATRTMDALSATWPVRHFPDWGHYPMIDDPAGWSRHVRDAVAATPALP